MKTVVYQEWLESERGWGQRPDGISLHKDLAQRDAFIKAYEKSLPEEVPDEYSRPCGEPCFIQVCDRMYREVCAERNGLRLYKTPKEIAEKVSEIRSRRLSY